MGVPIGKSHIDSVFSIAMFDYWRVYGHICTYNILQLHFESKIQNLSALLETTKKLRFCVCEIYISHVK